MTFAVWLLNKKGNRESTIERKMRYLKELSGSPQDMATQVLAKSWKDGTKENALDVVEQYAEYLNAPFDKPNFRAYDNEDMYMPLPELVTVSSEKDNQIL